MDGVLYVCASCGEQLVTTRKEYEEAIASLEEGASLDDCWAVCEECEL